MKFHFSVAQPRNGKQIFYQVFQPHGIVVDILVQSSFCICVQLVTVGKENAGCPGNGSQGSTEIVGDGAEQIGAQLFVLCQQSGLLHFLFAA